MVGHPQKRLNLTFVHCTEFEPAFKWLERLPFLLCALLHLS